MEAKCRTKSSIRHIVRGKCRKLDDRFPDAQLFAVRMVDDYFSYIVQFLNTCMAPFNMIVAWNKQLVVKATYYQLIAWNLYKMGADGILRRCVLENKRLVIIEEVNNGIFIGHYVGSENAHNILCAGV
jgi:hypothetical protein